MRTDDLCVEHADKGTKITVRALEEDVVLIEGNAEALGFLADLLRALGESNEDSRQIGPGMAGSALFSDQSTLGLYLSCVPASD
jgi:hypothetical protein